MGPRQLELPPNSPLSRFGRLVADGMGLAIYVEGIGMVLVKFGNRTDTIVGQKFIFIQHGL